jgi:hypothetical protein
MNATVSTKKMILFGVATAVLSGALVFDGVSRSRTSNSQANSPSAMTAPSVVQAAPAPAPATPTDPNINVQAEAAAAPADADADTTPDVAQGQAGNAGPAAQAAADDGGSADGGADSSADANQPVVIPAGTTLTVRLGEDLGSKISETGESFSGTLDQDVTLDGQTVVPAGTNVAGKVVLAKPFGHFEGEAALQLKLTSINLNDSNVPLASAVRSFGSPIKDSNKVRKVFKGLAKRAEGDEREVVLANQTAYSFTLRQALQIQ